VAKNYDDDFDIPQFTIKKGKFKSPKYKFNKSENDSRKSTAFKLGAAVDRDRAFARKLKESSPDVESYSKARKQLGETFAKMDSKGPKHTGDTFDMGKYVKNRKGINNKLVAEE
jgi:hypothetical protein